MSDERKPLRCGVQGCIAPYAYIQNGCLHIESQHHGHVHANVLSLAALEQLLRSPSAPAGEVEGDGGLPYYQGHRAAMISLLRFCLRELGIGDPEAQKAAWAVERLELVQWLRDACAEHGDNNWPDNLYLVDVLEKHLELEG